MSPLPPAGPLDSVDGRSLACLRPRQLAELLLVRRLLVREEGVGQGDGLHFLQVRVLDDRRIDEEADRHVHAGARSQPLLGEAEALHLVEILPRIRRSTRLTSSHYGPTGMP